MLQVSAGGIVINKNKVLLLQKKNGSYCLPKGHVETGETLEKTAVREVKEESNVDGKVLFYIGNMRYSYKNFGKKQIIDKEVHWFLMEALSFRPIPLNKEGFIWAGFKSKTAAMNLVRYRDEKEIIKDAFIAYKEIKK